jgi:hypothetical protein
MPSPAPRLSLLIPSLCAAALAAPAALADAPASVVLEGRLHVLGEDYADHARMRHILDTDRGPVELEFDARPANLHEGDRIRVRGRGLAQRPARPGEPVLALDGAQSGSVQVVSASAALSAYSMGQQNVAVILVNFSDNATQPITQAAAESLVFGQVNGYYQENSVGQTWLTGKSFPWVTISLSSTVCDYSALATQAIAAVKAAGGNPDAYARKVLMFPKNACGWAGLGNLGGGATNAWLNGRFTLQVASHEFGHNLGLQHAHALNCDTGVSGGTCTTIEYGDVADTLGNIASAHVSPFAKERLGWLNDGISPPIATASAAGRYTIEAYSNGSVGTKAIKIPRGTDGSGRKLWYYVEYRQPIGNDAVLTSGNLTRGLVVRTATEGDDNSSMLLDMTPGSYPTENTREMQDGALALGATYRDAAGISITPVSLDGASASVDVGFGGSTPPPSPTCTRAAPQVAIGGPTAAVAAGTTQAYTVTVTNKDSSACSAATFNLAASVPTGWSGVLSSSTLSLSPGASAGATLSATSPGSAAAGSYGIGVGASNLASGTASASIVYTVAAPLAPLSETVGSDKPTYVKGDTVRLTARVTANGVAVSGAAVSFRITKANGSVTTLSATSDASGAAVASTRLNARKDPAGSYAVTATASSQGRTASASTGFTVQ